ncbi:MAG: hypothetical protein GXY77_02455 [Fibrobacter sp.]|nr:hypothetical protein [Fibrobacter sp.]
MLSVQELKKRIKMVGLSNAEISESLKQPEYVVANWLNGNRSITDDAKIKIEKLLNNKREQILSSGVRTAIRGKIL